MAYQPGESGNPQGRPKGRLSTTPATVIRRAIEARAPELLTVLFDAAEAGDIAAASALLDRCAPRIKPTASTVLIDLSGSSDVITKALLNGVAEGDLPASEANDLLQLLKATQPPDAAAPPFDYEMLDRIYAEKLAKSAAEEARVQAEKSAGLR